MLISFKKIFLLCLSLGLFLLKLNVFASTVTPQAVAEQFYQQYIATEDYAAHKKLMAAYFVPSFYQQIEKQKANDEKNATDDDPGCISDFDVVLNAQDIPKQIVIGKVSQTQDKATVAVDLKFDPSSQVVVTLLKQGSQWKIADIGYPSMKTSLQTILTSCAKAQYHNEH